MLLLLSEHSFSVVVFEPDSALFQEVSCVTRAIKAGRFCSLIVDAWEAECFQIQCTRIWICMHDKITLNKEKIKQIEPSYHTLSWKLKKKVYYCSKIFTQCQRRVREYILLDDGIMCRVCTTKVFVSCYFGCKGHWNKSY